MSMAGKLLVVIPARGGSKGIVGKNIKLLAGKALLEYAIDNARSVAADKDICVSTDDPKIAAVAESYGISVPFLRPAELSGDTAGSYEVLLHALDHYAGNGVFYQDLLLLQPTSPFREDRQVKEALALYYEELPELLVSVRHSQANPYYNLFEEDARGYLQKSKESSAVRRQDAPAVYEYNGAIYLARVANLRERPFSAMRRVRKYVMDDVSSHDLDTPMDWMVAEHILENRKVN